MKHLRSLRGTLALAPLAVLTSTGVALAQEPEMREPAVAGVPAVPAESPAGTFGQSGQIAISSDAGLSIEHTNVSGVSGSTTTLRLRPALDYFLINNLSVGGFVGLDYATVPSGSTTTFAIGPRIGYNIAFTPFMSVWPRVGFSFTSTSTDFDDDALPPGIDASVTASNLAINLFAPLMFYPAEHFFLGFGPGLDVDLTGDTKTTTIAGRLTIGGWF
ncbi:MAG TPA: hypothetical protein VKY73_21955 [Polyangiaceae bacterium]|nr:hypothetical protein [Polyangiaceae bacterium]